MSSMDQRCSATWMKRCVTFLVVAIATMCMGYVWRVELKLLPVQDEGVKEYDSYLDFKGCSASPAMASKKRYSYVTLDVQIYPGLI